MADQQLTALHDALSDYKECLDLLYMSGGFPMWEWPEPSDTYGHDLWELAIQAKYLADAAEDALRLVERAKEIEGLFTRIRPAMTALSAVHESREAYRLARQNKGWDISSDITYARAEVHEQLAVGELLAAWSATNQGQE